MSEVSKTAGSAPFSLQGADEAYDTYWRRQLCLLGQTLDACAAGHSAPGPGPERWMTRSAAFGDRGALDWERAATTGRMMTERLPLLTPNEEEELLREAGFVEVALFYAAFSFRGWVATADPNQTC